MGKNLSDRCVSKLKIVSQFVKNHWLYVFVLVLLVAFCILNFIVWKFIFPYALNRKSAWKRKFIMQFIAMVRWIRVEWQEKNCKKFIIVYQCLLHEKFSYWNIFTSTVVALVVQMFLNAVGYALIKDLLRIQYG